MVKMFWRDIEKKSKHPVDSATKDSCLPKEKFHTKNFLRKFWKTLGEGTSFSLPKKGKYYPYGNLFFYLFPPCLPPPPPQERKALLYRNCFFFNSSPPPPQTKTIPQKWENFFPQNLFFTTKKVFCKNIFWS